MAKVNLPEGAVLRDLSAWYNQNTIPRNLLATQTLPPERWAQVMVEDGEVNLFLDLAKTPIAVTAGQPAVIPPGTTFSLASSGKPTRFRLLYFHGAVVGDSKELAATLGGHAA